MHGRGHDMRVRYALLIAGAMVSLVGFSPISAEPLVEIRTSDVDLFYKVYDAANGAPTAEALQHGYIDAGSDAVRQFVPERIKSATALATTIAQHRDVYEQARKCMDALPAMKTKLQEAFHTLANIDADATFPPVTVLIGRNSSAGSTGRSGVLIGLEVICRASWLQPDISERLLHLIAHEYGHIQESPDLNDPTKPTSVLKQSLVEGVAELVAELISGEVGNAHLKKWTAGRERAIGEAFLADADSQDVSRWLYSGVGTPEQPGFLGYWVGYRIAKAYYLKAEDKRSALKTLLALRDPKAILAESGWKP